jgi:hypothetical protein
MARERGLGAIARGTAFATLSFRMSRLTTSLRWSALLLPLLAACGGVVETSRDPGETSASKQTSGASGSSSKSSSSSTSNPDADTDLGAYKLGPVESYSGDKPCAWVADNRCYETHEMACNCACPRNHDSQCSSGFDAGADGHVWVACN